MSVLELQLRAHRMLTAGWFTRLAREAGLQLNQYGGGQNEFMLGAPTELNITAKFIPDSPFLKFISSDAARQELVDRLAAEAVARTEAKDWGGINWYSTSLDAEGFQLAPRFSMGTFFQQLGTQQRIVGWRRLGAHILLEFTEELPENFDEKNVLLAPKAIVHVHMAIPGPCVGHFSDNIARGNIETVAAICTFALGRGVSLPPTVFPSKAEQVNGLDQQRADPKVGNLARKGISLDIFSAISQPGGTQFFERMRATFLT